MTKLESVSRIKDAIIMIGKTFSFKLISHYTNTYNFGRSIANSRVKNYENICCHLQPLIIGNHYLKQNLTSTNISSMFH